MGRAGSASAAVEEQTTDVNLPRNKRRQIARRAGLPFQPGGAV